MHSGKTKGKKPLEDLYVEGKVMDFKEIGCEGIH